MITIYYRAFYVTARSNYAICICLVIPKSILYISTVPLPRCEESSASDTYNTQLLYVLIFSNVLRSIQDRRMCRLNTKSECDLFPLTALLIGLHFLTSSCFNKNYAVLFFPRSVSVSLFLITHLYMYIYCAYTVIPIFLMALQPRVKCRLCGKQSETETTKG